jgi:hypothetical protein
MKIERLIVACGSLDGGGWFARYGDD